MIMMSARVVLPRGRSRRCLRPWSPPGLRGWFRAGTSSCLGDGAAAGALRRRAAAPWAERQRSVWRLPFDLAARFARLRQMKHDPSSGSFQDIDCDGALPGRAPDAAPSRTGWSAARAGTGTPAAAAGRSGRRSLPGGASGVSAAPAGLGKRAQRRARPVDHRDRARARRSSRQRRQRWNWRRLSAPMIQTKCTPRGAPPQPGDRLVGEARADLRLEAGDGDARDRAPARAPPRSAHRISASPAVDFERIARRDEPPQPVEAQPAQREPRDRAGGRRAAD